MKRTVYVEFQDTVYPVEWSIDPHSMGRLIGTCRKASDGLSFAGDGRWAGSMYGVVSTDFESAIKSASAKLAIEARKADALHAKIEKGMAVAKEFLADPEGLMNIKAISEVRDEDGRIVKPHSYEDCK